MCFYARLCFLRCFRVASKCDSIFALLSWMQSPNYWQTVKICIISYHIFFSWNYIVTTLCKKKLAKMRGLLKIISIVNFHSAPNIQRYCNFVKWKTTKEQLQLRSRLPGKPCKLWFNQKPHNFLLQCIMSF